MRDRENKEERDGNDFVRKFMLEQGRGWGQGDPKRKETEGRIQGSLTESRQHDLGTHVDSPPGGTLLMTGDEKVVFILIVKERYRKTGYRKGGYESKETV